VNGIVIGIDPTIVKVGSFDLRWYGAFFAAAICAGIWLGLREVARKGINVEQAQALAFCVVVGRMIGARLFHVIGRWHLYAANPLTVFPLTVVDPVCGMQVDPETATEHVERDGHMYYFCSAGCREEFERNPEPYARSADAATARSAATPS
jgi:YHS domain-containing protein